MLFPNPEECIVRINNFPPQDSVALIEIWSMLYQNHIDVQIVQEKVLKTLRRWKAYRNQQGQKNENFVEHIFNNPELSDSLNQIISISRNNYSLTHILTNNEGDIEKLYNWLINNLFLNVPARIVIVSKTILMLCGFSLAFDSKVLKAIHTENKYLLTCAGVWPFCLYKIILSFVAEEQIRWEQQYNRSMNSLTQNYPIGQILDIILWAT